MPYIIPTDNGPVDVPARFEIAAHDVRMLTSVCHSVSIEKGWWHNPVTGEDLRPSFNVGEKLALVHSEVSEALEGHRREAMDDHLPHRKAIEVELADALIRIFDLGGVLHLDLGGALAEKMAYNCVRKDHTKEARLAEGGKKF